MSEKRFATPRLRRRLEVEHDANFQGTLSNIGEYGWEAMLIKGDPQTRFAYTVGVYDTMQLPELIVVGLTSETAHGSLHRAIEVYLSQTVQDREEAITYVSHDAEDGAWQFLGDKMDAGGGPVLSCFHHPVDWDASLKELHDLPLGGMRCEPNLERRGRGLSMRGIPPTGGAASLRWHIRRG